MKLYLFCGLVLLASCTKNLPTPLPVPISLEGFKTSLIGKQYHVTGYTSSTGTIPMPPNTQEDVYSFGTELGVIKSLEPCIEYTVPLSVYMDGTTVMIDWVNLVVEYETFEVKEYTENYFVLQGKVHSIRYDQIKK